MPHKLLLADDSITIQRVIELTFADEDVQVVVVGDGRQAIERVRSERPDIVLADIAMPERDGYDVAAFVKSDPSLAHIPVLLLTGAFEPLDEQRARAVGCDGVLVKPFEPQMVISRVKELLANPRSVRPAAATPAAASLDAALAAPPRGHEVETSAPSPAAAGKVGDSIEDYFDRLDAAFANVASARAPSPAVRREDPDLSFSLDDLPPVPAAPPPARTGDPLTTWDPELPGDFAPARQNHVASAFAALLAAEEGDDSAPALAALAPPPAAITDDVIEEIVRRVIARMGDDSMRRLVLDTAERLVRDEIDRIKRTSGLPGA